jgi:hypothetical protein
LPILDTRSIPRTAKPKPDDPEQSKRFVETAEEVSADRDEEALARASKRIKSELPKDRKDRS